MYKRSTNCVGGIRDEWRASLSCRQSINDPPTALVGLSIALDSYLKGA